MFKRVAAVSAAAGMSLSAPVLAAPAHAPSCTIAERPAAITRAFIPDTPPLAKLMDLTGTAVIRVDLSEDGRVAATSVRKSSGIGMLDRAALDAAKSMVYAPEIHDCRAVTGSYALEVIFE